MLLNNGNEYPHGCWVCKNKLGQLSLQPCKHNMGLHLVSRSTRQASDSLAVGPDEHPAARVLIQGLLNLPEPFGPAKRSWRSAQHRMCLGLLALPAHWGWSWSSNNPSLLTPPIVTVAGGCKSGDARHAGWKRKAFKAPEAEFAGKPGRQEPHSALCHPPMVLKSLKRIFFFFSAFNPEEIITRTSCFVVGSLRAKWSLSPASEGCIPLCSNNTAWGIQHKGVGRAGPAELWYLEQPHKEHLDSPLGLAQEPWLPGIHTNRGCLWGATRTPTESWGWRGSAALWGAVMGWESIPQQGWSLPSTAEQEDSSGVGWEFNWGEWNCL